MQLWIINSRLYLFGVLSAVYLHSYLYRCETVAESVFLVCLLLLVLHSYMTLTL